MKLQLKPLLRVAIRYEQDIVTARQKTRDLARALGFDSQDQARLATGVSELTRNVYQYAQTGMVEFHFSLQFPQSLVIKVEDNGPGIKDLESILNGTYQSPTGMGVGLLGTKKLADFFEVNSSSEGTNITFGKNFPSRAKPLDLSDLNRVVAALMTQQPGSAFEEIQNQNRDLLTALSDASAARKELAQLNEELAETNRGVVALYAELDEKAESLQKVNEVKTNFLSNMTHEFRTPLSSVISLTRMLLSRVDGELTPEQEKQVRYIQSSSEGLLELVNDLLDLAKVEAGKVSISVSEFHVEELLGSLRGMFRPILNQSVVEFDVQVVGSGFDMETDQAKLSQILRNFISNAVKFTDKGSIHLCAELLPNDWVQFKVRDTGIGIDQQNIQYIFEEFSQIESYLQRKQKGTGLGLPLSKKLSTLLGGTLEVTSQVGKGSEFLLTVPRKYTGESERVLISPTMSPSAAPLPELAASEYFRVLIVDDDEPSRYILKSLISQELDAIYMEAKGGREGLDLIESWRPDVVFLDLSMPDISGMEVLNRLHDRGLLAHLPVIVNTSAKLTAEEVTLLKTKATSVLSKDRPDDQLAKLQLRTALKEAGFDYAQKGSV